MNHPNRSNTRRSIVVYTFGSATETWPNLAGVFAREFPIACGQARLGKAITVTYYGQRYTIAQAA